MVRVVFRKAIGEGLTLYRGHDGHRASRPPFFGSTDRAEAERYGSRVQTIRTHPKSV
jgi:hypothetical protein